MGLWEELLRTMRRPLLVLITVLLAGLALVPAAHAQDAAQPVVRAVMFWMDSCGHCHYVLEEVLPPLQQQYGEQFDLTLIEIKSAADADRLVAVANELGVGGNGIGVPFLIIGQRALVGSEQIPAELPDLIEMYLAEGGVELPELNALEGVLPAVETAPEIAPAGGVLAPTPVAPAPIAASEAAAPALQADELAADPGQFEGELIAIVVLAAMVLALVATLGGLALVRAGRIRPPAAPWLAAVIPGLAAVGLLVAGYLAYVETQSASAVCGPVGDCNAVQSSPYASILGVPVGVLGIVGYVAILLVWAWGQWSGRGLPHFLLVLMTAGGVIFSIYLTWLEIDVIRAVCMWCISSAVIMMLLLLASTGLAAAWLAEDQEAGDAEPALEG